MYHSLGLVSLAASLASAIVLPEPEVFAQIPVVANQPAVAAPASNVLDDAFAKVDLTSTRLDFGNWLDEHTQDIHFPPLPKKSNWPFNWHLPKWTFPGHHKDDPHHRHPHGPHHGHPHDPHHRLHHSHPHYHTNLTIYQVITTSEHTTHLAEFLKQDKHLVQLLNSTKANYTFFAPGNSAFAHLPEDTHPPKQLVEKFLHYHVVAGWFPSWKLAWLHTVPTLLRSDGLAGHSQRLRASWSLFSGLRLNFRNKIVIPNIIAANGIIHGLDTVVHPPLDVAGIITRIPAIFATLENALRRTDLLDKFNSTGEGHPGKTLFAPTNEAWLKLGMRANAFLFSDRGKHCLKALLEYHLAPNVTLYSTALYDTVHEDGQVSDSDAALALANREHVPHPGHHGGHHGPHKKHRFFSHAHSTLPTLLGGNHTLSVDMYRTGPLVHLTVNGVAHVEAADGVAADGVVHVVSRVLIPPKKTLAAAGSEAEDDEAPLDEFELMRRFGLISDFAETGIDDDQQKFEF